MNRANVHLLPLFYFCKAISLTQFAFWSLYIFTQLIYKNQYACPTLGKNLGHEWEQYLEYWSCGVSLKQSSELSGRLGFRVSGGVRTSGPSKSIMRKILLSEVSLSTKENWGQVFKALIHKVYFLFAVLSFLFFPWKTLNLWGQVLLWVPFPKAIGNRKRKP